MRLKRKGDRRLNRRHHCHSLPHHRHIHHKISTIFFFFKKTFFTNPPSNCTDQSHKRIFQVDQRRLVEFETQPRTVRATNTLNQWRRSRANWATSARGVGLGAAMRPNLATAVARMLGLGIWERDQRQGEWEIRECKKEFSGTSQNVLKLKRNLMIFSF